MLLVVAVGLFSCSGRNVDYARVIPQDAEVVAALELRDLYKKGNFDVNALSEFLSDAWVGSQDGLSMLRDGNSVGIATDYPVYIFVLSRPAVDSLLQVDSVYDSSVVVDDTELDHDSIVTALEVKMSTAANDDTTSSITPAVHYEDLMEAETSPSRSEDIAFVAKVSDRAKLEEAIVRSGFSVEDSASASYGLYHFDDIYVAVDDERVVVTGRGDLLPRLMGQTKEASFISGKGFEKMEKLSGDVRLICSLKALMDESARRNNYSVMLPRPTIIPTKLGADLMQAYDLSKVYWVGALAFESGKVVLDVAIHSEDKGYSATIEQNAQALLTPSGEFSKFFGKESLFWANMSFDGSRLVDVFKRMKVQNMLQELTESTGLDLVALLSSVKGDVTLGMSDIDATVGTSDFRIYAQLESEGPFRALIARLEQETAELADSTALEKEDGWGGLFPRPKFTKVDDNNYLYHNGIFGISFSFKDKVLGFSVQGGDKATDKIWCTVSGDDIADQPLVKPVRNKSTGFVYNNLATLSSPALAPVLAFVPRGVVAELRKISGLRAYTVSATEQRVELLLVDEKTNALEQLIGIGKVLSR